MLAIQVLQQMIWQMGALLYSPVFWLAVLLVYLQARQRSKQKQEFFQLRREPVGKAVVWTITAGLAGGFLASGSLLLLGISIDQIGLEYLWKIALFLMLIRQRFLCFAYSGGILSLLCWLSGYPAVDVSQLLALVAVLHITESFLVLTTGHLSALPVYLKKDEQVIIGGFLLQMIWPLPLVMLSAWNYAALPQAGFLPLPDWWPVLKSGQHGYNIASIFLLLPVLAALGYSDLAVSHNVRQKTRHSAIQLFLYSTLLLLLVVLTKYTPTCQIIPILFAPLGHEIMIWYSKRQEMRGPQRFQTPKTGVLVLDVQQGSPAAKAGLRSEDWILQFDGQLVKNQQEFLQLQSLLYGVADVIYLRRGKKQCCQINMERWEHSGILLTPDGNSNIYWNLTQDEGIAKFLYKKLVNRLKKM